MALGFMYSMHPMHPVFGLSFMILIWLVQLVIAYLVYKDAKEQKMSPLLWFILVIVPMFGFLVATIYVIIRSFRMPMEPQKNPLDILKERLAKGEITTEEYERRKSALME
jgi:putative membrane protein